MQENNELWDRLWQVTSDVVAFADELPETDSSKILREQLVRSAMRVGAEVVRAQAADDPVEYQQGIVEARLKAIETDYWLRLAYTLQQESGVQQDLSTILSQYQSIVDHLISLGKHVGQEQGLKKVAGKRIVN